MTDEKKKNSKTITKKILWAVAAVAVAAALFFAGYGTYYLTMDEGLKSLLWIKEKMQDEYYEAIDDDDFWQAAIDGAEKMLDRYSCYYTADEYDAVLDSGKGLRAGVGLSFFAQSNKISKVAIGSPVFFAQQNADFSGAWVTGVGASRDSIEDAFTFDVLSEKMGKFSEGDRVFLRFSSENGTDADADTCTVIEVSSANYQESYVLYAAGGYAYAVVYGEDGGVWTDVSAYTDVDEKVPEGQTYIKLTQFNGNAAAEFARAAKQYRGEKTGSVLLDLRNDGGGKLSILQEISAYFLANTKESKPVVLKAVHRSGQQEIARASGNVYSEYFADSEIYVAANFNTASASEALIGVMIDYGALDYGNIFITDLQKGGEYVPSTYGKGIMQTTFSNYLTGEAIKLTTAKIYWPKGKCIHDVGITIKDGAVSSPSVSAGEFGDPELSSIFQKIAER